MKENKILIASSALDEGSWGPVAEKLSRAGCEAVVYLADQVANGQEALRMSLSPSGQFEASYANEALELDNISAAWFRRPNMFSVDIGDRALQNTLDTERRVLQYGLWSAIPPERWVTSPLALYHAEHKIVQLRTAASVGFTVPATVVTNNWHDIASLGPRIIYKPSYGTLYDRDGMRLLYTTSFENSEAQLPTNALPFPGLWQDYAPKLREWRVTVIGTEVFPAAIYTAGDAKDDWRRHPHRSAPPYCLKDDAPDEWGLETQ